MSFPIKQQVLNNILAERDLTDVSKTTIRQCAAIAAEMEKAAGEKFLRLEVGVPGLAPGQIGVDAQKAALDNGIASIYPAISGLPELKENASRFIKAFIDVDINPECIVPTVGSMQAGMNLMLECSQLDPAKDTILYVNPGFAPHVMQAQVQGIKHEQFDIYEYRGAKLRDKLEEFCSNGNIVWTSVPTSRCLLSLLSSQLLRAIPTTTCSCFRARRFSAMPVSASPLWLSATSCSTASIQHCASAIA